MSIKPVIREVKEAVLRGFRHADARLHQLGDNHSDHLKDVVRKVRGQDRYEPSHRADGRPRVTGGRGYLPLHARRDELVPKPSNLTPDGKIDWSQAPKGGFRLDGNGDPIKHDHTPRAGDVFDRYGGPGGRYVSPVPGDGPFSYGSRSLPYEENPSAYHQYEWTRDLSELPDAYQNASESTREKIDALLAKYGGSLMDMTSVQRGEAAPAFGEPGGAVQDLLPLSPNLLQQLGMIREIR